MKVHHWKLFAMPLAVLGLASPMLASCTKKPTKLPTDPTAAATLPATCYEVFTGDVSKVQIDAPAEVQAKMKRLMLGGWELSKRGKDVERELIEVCTEIGKSAGAGEEEMRFKPDKGHGAEQLCTLVGTKVGKILREAKAAKVEITIEMEPAPHCFVDVDDMTKCLAECGTPVSVDPRAACAGGDVAGACKGRCAGSCTLDSGTGSGFCHGSCKGKCDRDFRGTCNGRCDGTCDGSPTKGTKHCNGICDGKCDRGAEGLCNGKCDGVCSHGWEPINVRQCTGVCVGQCEGPLESPLCMGDYAPKGADVPCMASCTGRATLASRCEAPLIRVTAKNGRQTVELQKLLYGLQINLPKLARIRQGTSKKLAHAVELMVAAGVEMTNTYALAGPKALVCVRTATDAAKEGAEFMDVAVKGAEAVPRALKEGAEVQTVSAEQKPLNLEPQP
jgi:hypothetical protein